MIKAKRLSLLLALCFAIILLAITAASASAPTPKDIILTTTTSVQDSGLLDELIPVFEKQTGYTIKTIAVGSGQAMAMGKRGEADVLIVHSPAAEQEFMDGGFGSKRRLIMHNYFVFVGPPNDPAKIKGLLSAKEAFQKIANGGFLFVSRSDNSGTHSLEKKVWGLTGIKTEGQQWHQQTGLGMGQTLGVANEKDGYTLTDKATYLSMKNHLRLVILVGESEELYNPYSVIEINPQKFPKVNAVGAKAFAKFMLSKQTQKLIANYGTKKVGEGLFFPDALKKVGK